MGNFTVLGAVVVKAFVIAFPILFLLLLLKKRKNKVSLVIIVSLFLLTTINAVHFFIAGEKEKNEFAKKYLGVYKLNKLDCRECDNCKVDLNADCHYDIIQNGKIIGNGEWNIEINPETGYFLKIENGPSYINHEPAGQIDYISRKPCR